MINWGCWLSGGDGGGGGGDVGWFVVLMLRDWFLSFFWGWVWVDVG